MTRSSVSTTLGVWLGAASLFALACGDDGVATTVDTAPTSSPTSNMTTSETDPSTSSSGTTTAGSMTMATTAGALCGNGQIDDGELCDDGNEDNTDECTILCMEPECDDGIQSGTESDVDCGQDCLPCDDGEMCNSGLDCESLSCVNGTCAAAACDDGVLNGDETKIDCGGACGECVPPELVFNEVDYDQVGMDDTMEFIEIYNAGDDIAYLENLRVLFVNGINMNNEIYDTVNLIDAGPSLPPGGYLVVGVPAVTDNVPDGVLTTGININIQNGDMDGLVLYDADPNDPVLLDSVAYEGDVLGLDVPELGVIDLQPSAAGDSNTDPGSIQRIPNGADNDSPDDWQFVANVTPGAANTP